MSRVAPTPALARLRGQFPPPATQRVILHRCACGPVEDGQTVSEVVRAHLSDLVTSLVEGTCDGACWATPSATVQREGHQHRFARLEDTVPDALARCVAGDCDDEYAGRGEYGLLERLGRQDGSFEDAVGRGAYGALAHAVSVGPERARDAVLASNFPKRHPLPHPGEVLTVAASEDSQTSFADCHLLAGDPHRVVEGILVACLLAGARSARVHLDAQPEEAGRALAHAIEQAGQHGILDGSALGGSAFEVALVSGLPDGAATNVESACALTAVFDKPPPPTRLVALSGAVPRPGLYEAPADGTMTWTGVLAMAGVTPGLVPGLHIGGATAVTAEALDEPMTAHQLGDGTVVVLPSGADV